MLLTHTPRAGHRDKYLTTICGYLTTLFVDDSLNILEAAKTIGIKYVLAVKNPDSKQPHREIEGYPAISDYRTLIDDITNHPFDNA